MNFKFQTIIFAILAIGAVNSLNFNITNLSNCVDIALNYPKDAEIEVRDVVYEKNTLGFVDTLNGKYVVHAFSDHIDSELIMTFFKCPSGSSGMCKEVDKEVKENMDCKRYLTDTSGPWYVFAPSMDQTNVCAQFKGEYDFVGAHLKGDYLEKYMTIEEGHYRIRMLYHLPGQNMDLKNLRGCIELDFDIMK